MQPGARGLPALALVALAAAGCSPATHPAAAPAPAPAAVAGSGLQVPIEYHRLDNGLRVVLSPDHSAPKAVVAVYYNIGFRIEPRNRTGFAHLFEHMMFQGSRNLGKLEFIRLVESNGGVLNGSTNYDFTNYFQIVPAHTLETVLWAEADRMRGLDISRENLANQQEVVKNEVRVNVLNQPYGGFPWLHMPQAANTNWYNAHNFYGELDELDAATMDDVRQFFATYYAPSNAALVITGDFEPAAALALVRRYFADIPAGPPPSRPDISEPRQEGEKRSSRTDSLANRPALAVAYHVPPRNTPEWYAMGLLDQILGQGRDSRLYQELVQRRAYTGSVGAGINAELGNMFTLDGPALWTAWLYHDATVPVDSILGAIDRVVEPLLAAPVDQATLDAALVKMRSSLYGWVDEYYGFGRADLLGIFALFDDDPGRINRVEDEFRRVTPELLMRTAREYLRPGNRTVLSIIPAGTGR